MWEGSTGIDRQEDASTKTYEDLSINDFNVTRLRYHSFCQFFDMTMMRLSVIAALLASTTAFAPVSNTRFSTSATERGAVSRRDALGLAFAGFVAGAVSSPSPANAGINPALETFKSKKTGSSFYPGKGMREKGRFRRLFLFVECRSRLELTLTHFTLLLVF